MEKLRILCVLSILVTTQSLCSAQLFLTPLIKAGNISEARNLAEVKDLIPNDYVKSYTGFITVNETFNTNLFFWYFPAVVSSIINFLTPNADIYILLKQII